MSSPPGIDPWALITSGSEYRPSCSSSIPSSSRAFITGPSGRSYERGSPSNAISPWASAASGGRKRITVPAFPTSICAGPVSGEGVTVQAFSLPVIDIPIAWSPADISSESREMSGRRTIEGEIACEARMSARFVTDLDPGIVT
ncbi:unannotated protein [freshwater metagenome]|uniref:Unannotated protein n=1 Tax=freshwater metagenome TaxID=449393 RepID=A0A6J7NWJ8_9ZZZZ